jgi:ketosteroid isomerase-like protein
MKKIPLFLISSILTISLLAQDTDSTNQDLDKIAVKRIVESFLSAAGDHDIEAIPAMFTSKANISGASLKNEKWNSYRMTIQEFITALKSNSNPTKYIEPVDNWIIHIEGGQLAFVRADATLFRDGKPQSHNIDYFTLVKEGVGWKILNGSYVSTPIEVKSK